MFQVIDEVISVYKFNVNGTFEGTAVANIKVKVTLTKVRGDEELQVHTKYEFESDAESGGAMEYEARGMVTVKDDRRPTAIELYDIVVFNASRVFDILIGNCMVAKVNIPQKPDMNMLEEDILEMLEQEIERIYDRDELTEKD